jgi:hypothetical protein
MAVKSNIVIDQGTDFEVSINVLDANTTAISLAGFTGQAQLRKYYTSSRKYDFAVTISANTGEVTLAMSANTSANIAAGRYLYDCVLTQANIVSRIVEGIVTINPRITR